MVIGPEPFRFVKRKIKVISQVVVYLESTDVSAMASCDSQMIRVVGGLSAIRKFRAEYPTDSQTGTEKHPLSRVSVNLFRFEGG